MKAGIDFGSSLVKAVWKEEGNYQFFTTADSPLEALPARLRIAGITEITAAGIGFEKDSSYFSDFTVDRSTENLIEEELALQVTGVKTLLSPHQLDTFLLVSLGTGTSYTFVDNEKIIPKMGSGIGGGFIYGLMQMFGIGSFLELSLQSTTGKNLDLLIKDMLPKTEGIQGEYSIAYFGKAKPNYTKEDACNTIITTAAKITIENIMRIKDKETFDTVVLIGTPLVSIPPLQYLLKGYLPSTGIKPIVPLDPEYALALGAYHKEK